MTATERLAEIKARAEAATEGPWEWDPPREGNWLHMEENLWSSPGREPVVTSWGHDADGIDASDEDRAFIAHARTDVPALVAALEAVLELHQPGDWSDDEAEYTSCRHCGEAALYPCPTVEAINEALGEDQS